MIGLGARSDDNVLESQCESFASFVAGSYSKHDVCGEPARRDPEAASALAGGAEDAAPGGAWRPPSVLAAPESDADVGANTSSAWDDAQSVEPDCATEGIRGLVSDAWPGVPDLRDRKSVV